MSSNKVIDLGPIFEEVNGKLVLCKSTVALADYLDLVLLRYPDLSTEAIERSIEWWKNLSRDESGQSGA